MIFLKRKQVSFLDPRKRTSKNDGYLATMSLLRNHRFNSWIPMEREQNGNLEERVWFLDPIMLGKNGKPQGKVFES
jgi:hypothetical protein